jgi:predicted metal-dependent peptidase
MTNGLKNLLTQLSTEQKLALEIHEIMHAVLTHSNTKLKNQKFYNYSVQELYDFLQRADTNG